MEFVFGRPGCGTCVCSIDPNSLKLKQSKKGGEEMDKHYACPGGCGGKSIDMKACDTEGCEKNGQMMKECDCQDNEHAQVMATTEDIV